MSRVHVTEAIVLRAYDVGEADRLCILLTKDFGRLATRVRGARRLTSRLGGAMLPLYHVQVELREGSAGFATMRAVCIDTHKECRDDPFAYACAHRAIDLLSKSLEDDVPVPDVFLLFSDFLNALTGSHDPILLDLFIVRFLHLFGALPSLQESVASHRMFAPNDTIVFSTRHHGFCRLDEDSHGYALSPQTHAFLREVFLGSLVKIVQHVPASVRQELGSIVAFISGANGLAPLPVRRANSSAVTPI